MYKGIPWFSFLILICAYGIFGHLYGEQIIRWQEPIGSYLSTIGLVLTPDHVLFWLKMAGMVMASIIAIVLTAPLALFRILLGDWLESDTKALLSIFVWAFVVVLVVSWLEAFLNLLVLFSAATLIKLDLQAAKVNHKLSAVILVISCVFGFLLGSMTAA
jgi:voltage-gated potassium channel Kch